MRKMQNKKNSKKGELSTQQIVLLIILIASFVIILFFLFRLNPGSETDLEACHHSVVLRGNKAIPTEAIPLNCQTKYLCISEDGTCEGLTKPKLKKVNTKEELYDALALEMADCWWMFGEGEINYVGKDMKENLYCSICTQFVLDDSIANVQGINSGRISEKEFYQHLESKKMELSEESYLEYLTGFKTVSDLESNMAGSGGEFKEYVVGSPYYVMMGMYSDVGAWKWATAGIVAGSILAAPFTGGSSLGVILVLGVGGAAGGAGGYFVGTTVVGDSGQDYLTPVILKANSREFQVFNCKDIMTVS